MYDHEMMVVDHKISPELGKNYSETLAKGITNTLELNLPPNISEK